MPQPFLHLDGKLVTWNDVVAEQSLEEGYLPLPSVRWVSGDIELTVSWLTNLVFTTIGNTNHTGKADLSIELTSVIDLDISFLYLRTENPAPPPDPADPPIQKNDYQLVVGVSLKLG